jgi:hypothetical protein
MTTMTRTQTLTTTTSAGLLVELVDDALLVAADDETGAFDSRTPTGRALLSLAALARRAAGILGAEPGVPLTSGPAVVVERELAAAARLLDEAVSRTAGPADVDGVLAAAKGIHAQLHDAVARSAR